MNKTPKGIRRNGRNERAGRKLRKGIVAVLALAALKLALAALALATGSTGTGSTMPSPCQALTGAGPHNIS